MQFRNAQPKGRLAVVVTVAAVLTLTHGYAADAEAKEIMRKVASAIHSLKFEGELVVEISTAKDRRSRREYIYQDHARLRIESIKTGKQDRDLVVIVNAGSRNLFHPKQKTVFRYPLKDGQRFSLAPPAGEARSGLQPQIVGEEEIARRSTWLIELRRKNGSVAARLWVDKEKYLLLKREALAADGTVTDSRAFVSINFDTSFGAEKFELPPDVQVRTVTIVDSHEALRREASLGTFRLINTADLESRYGFHFDGGEVTRDESGKQIEEVWFRFRNSQGRLSIFQRRDRGMIMPDKSRAPRPGQLIVRKNGWLITLMGTFKPNDLPLFADTLEVTEAG